MRDLDFQPATITKEGYDLLVKYIKTNNIKSVLEFGPGISTYAFIDCGCDIVTLEHADWFYEKYKKEFAEYPNVAVMQYKNLPYIDIQLNKRFDMAFIDAPPAVALHPFSRLNTCEFAARYTKVILLHDAQRIGEMLTQALFNQRGWSVKIILVNDKGIAEMKL